MKFLSIAKITAKYNANYVELGNGSVSAMSLANVKNCRKHRVWVGVNEKNELKASPVLLGNGNYWVDDLADDLANGRVKAEDLQ